MNAPASEKRLEQLREKAWQEGVAPGRGVDVIGGPIPRKPGFYGEPVVKPPVWTWQVPLYFFFGGLAGMSAVIAPAANTMWNASDVPICERAKRKSFTGKLEFDPT
jgi:hypothetical protein